jgi:hypothetical protein
MGRQTNDNGYILIGYTESFGFGTDVYVVKTDSQGNEMWSKNFGGNNYDHGQSGQQTIDNGYIIVGMANSFGAGNLDVYLIKTDGLGNEILSRTFGGSNEDRGVSVIQINDGNYIIVGYTYSYGAGGSDVYLIKTDAQGNSPIPPE